MADTKTVSFSAERCNQRSSLLVLKNTLTNITLFSPTGAVIDVASFSLERSHISSPLVLKMLSQISPLLVLKDMADMAPFSPER